MCEICMQTPCHPRCPNAEQMPVCVCGWCGYEIYEGDVMYVIDDTCVCEGCIDECKRFAEFED